MSFSDIRGLGDFLISLGVVNAYYKPLAENDNSKEGIYLTHSFAALQQFPFGEIKEFPEFKEPNFKAKVNLLWINDQREYAYAPKAQLILYSRYPEVRLSGFMNGCHTAPRGYMNPVSAEERRTNNGKDGRVLIFGVTSDSKIYLYLAKKDTSLARQIFAELYEKDIAAAQSTIYTFPIDNNQVSDKNALLAELRKIVKRGWIDGMRMYPNGSCKPYYAVNAGGYTLEASFGIIPNGIAEPDYRGWELKAYTGNRITLMTPEPDKGFYHEKGAKDFTLKYGHPTDKALAYFTGTHKAGILCSSTGLTLALKGYDIQKKTIDDVSGGICLLDKESRPIAIWSFSLLLKHWCRKHAHACYVHYNSEKSAEKIRYIYTSPVHLGERTDFPKFLDAVLAGDVVYDPGIKVSGDSVAAAKVHARNQFRITTRRLSSLYETFYPEDVS